MDAIVTWSVPLPITHVDLHGIDNGTVLYAVAKYGK